MRTEKLVQAGTLPDHAALHIYNNRRRKPQFGSPTGAALGSEVRTKLLSLSPARTDSLSLTKTESETDEPTYIYTETLPAAPRSRGHKIKRKMHLSRRERNGEELSPAALKTMQLCVQDYRTWSDVGKKVPRLAK